MPSVIAGKYRLLRRLGTGGMAEVFVARQTGAADFEKLVAIKTVLPHLADDRQIVEMFIDEARITAQLSHSNIVQIFDFGIDGGLPYIVMEYVRGVTLRSLLTRCIEASEALPVELATSIMIGVCRGLDYAHRKTGSDGKPLGIVHRDLDPQNVFLSFEGEVKIGDFGIARTSIQQHQTGTGIIKGKLQYIAPEVVREGEIGQRADLYSLGVVLYEMLGGKKPFDPLPDPLLMKMIMRGQFQPLCLINPSLDPSVADVAQKAMAVNPNRRYQTSKEMLDALETLESSFPKRADSYSLQSFLDRHFPVSERIVTTELDDTPIEPSASKTGNASEYAFENTTSASVSLPIEPSDTPPSSLIPPTESHKRKPFPWRLLAASALLAVIFGAAFLFNKTETASRIEATPVVKPVLSTPVPAPATPEPSPVPAETPKPLPATVAATPSVFKSPSPPVATPEPTLKTGPAYLSFGADIGCNVFMDGSPIGATPIGEFKVKSGAHQIVFKNEKLGLAQTVPVSVNANEKKNVHAVFLASLMVHAKPWAKVYLDKIPVGETPLLKKDIKPGSHVIRIVNESLGKDYEVVREFVSGQSVNLSENLEP